MIIFDARTQSPSRVATFLKGLALVPLGLLAALILLFLNQNQAYFRMTFLDQGPKIEPANHFFDTAATFSIDSKIAGTIRYTLDGRPPTASDSSVTVSDSIHLTESAIIRYALFRNQEPISEIYDHAVFIGQTHQLPVVSIATDPAHLFDSEIGMYTEENFQNSGSDWERPASIQYFDRDQELAFQRPIGLRLHGGGSRGLPQKSFRLYFPEENPVLYPIFDENENHEYHTLILRNAGADAKSTFMRDALMHRLAAQATNLDVQAVQPAAVYLNGRYWGLYHVRERQNQSYLTQHHGLPESDVNIIEVPHTVSDERGKMIAYQGQTSPEDARRFNNLLSDLQRCDGCFDYSTFEKTVDVENAIDYLIFEFHSANFDWPYGNYRAWRYDTPLPRIGGPAGADGRFRFLLFDLDVGLGFGSTNSAQIKKAAINGKYGRLIDNSFPMRTAFFNPRFKREYLIRYADLLNTTFTTAHVQATIQELAQEMRPEMPNHIARWGGLEDKFGNHVPKTVQDWEAEVSLLMEYAEHRPQAMFANTVTQFELEGTYQLELRVDPPEAGTIALNTLGSLPDYPWTGTYFIGPPIQVEAESKSGYRFSHWAGLPENHQTKQNQRSFSLTQDNDLELTAVFEVQ